MREEGRRFERAPHLLMESSDDLKDVQIWTRGVTGKDGVGGYGAVLVAGEKFRQLCGAQSNASSNRMDLVATIAALKKLRFRCRVQVWNSNAYLVDAMRQDWPQKWQKNGWRAGDRKPIANADLWLELLSLVQNHEVSFERLALSGQTPQPTPKDRRIK